MNAKARRSRAAGRVRRFLALAALLLALPSSLVAQATRHVILVVTDGLRWQEVFRGADSTLLFTADGGAKDSLGARRTFWRPALAERRRALLPFVWGTMATQGQLFGNRDDAGQSRVTNGLKFSYPGYQEILAGFPDSAITSNDDPPNRNRTVFEWLHGRPGFAGKVSAFGTWDAFPRIFNRERAGFLVHAAWEPPPFRGPLTPLQAQLDRLYRTTTHVWDDVSYDSFMHEVAKVHVLERRPRALYLGYGETDMYAHERRYDLYLRSARQVDAFLEELWALYQAMPETRGRTTLIVTTDHGRGHGADWTDHGRRTDGAEDMWIAILGPDTPAMGVRREAVTQAQVAATLAAALGEDWPAAERRAAPPIPGAIRPSR